MGGKRLDALIDISRRLGEMGRQRSPGKHVLMSSDEAIREAGGGAAASGRSSAQ